MKRATLLLLMTLGTAAQAQPATESVTVTGARSRQVLDRFVQSFAAPTRRTGKLARWDDGVCPTAVGLKPVFARYISQRLKTVAAEVGAPVNTSTGCKPNIEIIFTTAPQALMDNVRRKQASYIGYHDNSHQADELAKVTHAIQAWYTTATRDLRGRPMVDSAALQGVGEQSNIQGDTSALEFGASAVTGSRLGDGRRSTLYHVIIVAEPAKLLDHEIGALADYIAMLALTQLSSLDACQHLPSIVNLLAPGCSNPAQSLTESDLGYLRGLYKMGPSSNLRGQEDAIASAMQQQLDGK